MLFLCLYEYLENEVAFDENFFYANLVTPQTDFWENGDISAWSSVIQRANLKTVLLAEVGVGLNGYPIQYNINYSIPVGQCP